MEFTKDIFLHFLIIIFFSSCSDLSIFEKEKELISIYENSFAPRDFSIDDTLVVMSWNIQMGFRNDQNAFNGNDVGGTPSHFDQMVNAIKEINPDIIALQEVGHNADHTFVENQAQYLANALKMNFAYADYSEIITGYNILTRGARGHALLTKFTINETENIVSLQQGRYLRRSVLNTTIKLNDQNNLNILGLHFASRAEREEKINQSNHLIQIALEQRNPVILLGDYNDVHWSYVLTPFEENGFSNALLEESNPCQFNVEHYGSIGHEETAWMGVLIDHILFSKKTLNSYSLCLGDESTWTLSNHKPIIGKLLLKK
ncbi:MAG: endonuclease/exonuclease/phosphatase family protein [Chitinophagales bacterium]|nr:endonuclease/exonuclease/phosphatase family protein [Chitinophagales bacterium]